MPNKITSPDLEMDNDQPEHRAALVAALRQEELDAYEYHSGGGLMHVVVDLLRDDTSDDLLQIATGSVASPCDVSLMGWRNGGHVQDDDRTRTPTLQDAVHAFRGYMAEKESWVGMFLSGALDV